MSDEPRRRPMTYDEAHGIVPEWKKRMAEMGRDATPANGAASEKPAKAGRKAGRPDRWGVFNSMVDHHLATMSENELRVWVSLFRMCSAPFWTATVGQSVIADRCGISTRTVKRMICRLEARGMVEAVRRGNAMIGPSTYRVTARPPRVTD